MSFITIFVVAWFVISLVMFAIMLRKLMAAIQEYEYEMASYKDTLRVREQQMECAEKVWESEKSELEAKLKTAREKLQDYQTERRET